MAFLYSSTEYGEEKGGAVRLLGALCMLVGLFLMILSVEETFARLDWFGGPNATAPGVVKKLDLSRTTAVVFHTPTNLKVEFRPGTLVDPPRYGHPYLNGERVTVAYDNPSGSGGMILDNREWVRVSLIAIFGFLVSACGLLLRSLGPKVCLCGVVFSVLIWPHTNALMQMLFDTRGF